MSYNIIRKIIREEIQTAINESEENKFSLWQGPLGQPMPRANEDDERMMYNLTRRIVNYIEKNNLVDEYLAIPAPVGRATPNTGLIEFYRNELGMELPNGRVINDVFLKLSRRRAKYRPEAWAQQAYGGRLAPDGRGGSAV